MKIAIKQYCPCTCYVCKDNIEFILENEIQHLELYKKFTTLNYGSAWGQWIEFSLPYLHNEEVFISELYIH